MQNLCLQTLVLSVHVILYVHTYPSRSPSPQKNLGILRGGDIVPRTNKKKTVNAKWRSWTATSYTQYLKIKFWKSTQARVKKNNMTAVNITARLIDIHTGAIFIDRGVTRPSRDRTGSLFRLVPFYRSSIEGQNLVPSHPIVCLEEGTDVAFRLFASRQTMNTSSSVSSRAPMRKPGYTTCNVRRYIPIVPSR